MVSCFRSGDIAHRMDLPKVLSPCDPRSWPDKTHSTRLTSHTRGLGGIRTEARRSHQELKAQTKVREAKARKAHTLGQCAGRCERRQHHGGSASEKLTGSCRELQVRGFPACEHRLHVTQEVFYERMTGSTGEDATARHWHLMNDWVRGFDLRLPPVAVHPPPKASVPLTPRRSIFSIERLASSASELMFPDALLPRDTIRSWAKAAFLNVGLFPFTTLALGTQCPLFALRTLAPMLEQVRFGANLIVQAGNTTRASNQARAAILLDGQRVPETS